MRPNPTALFALALALVPSAQAGSVDNRNNNSAEYIRNVSRNAATEGADVSIYNPAGAVKLEDGLHLSIANQTFSKFNQHSFKSTATAPTESYTSDIVSPFYPTAFAAYKKGAWAGFMAYSYPGGGGELDYKKGSATTFLIESNLRTTLPTALHADAYLRSIYYGGTLGGSYAPKDWVSVSLAARTIYARTDINVDAGKDFPPGNTSKVIDHMEEARGYSGVLGVDFFPTPEWILAVRYETVTPLEWEVQKSNLNLDNVIKDATTRNGYIAKLRSVLRAPGSKFDRDLPAVLGLGAGWKFLPGLRADLSANVYFNSSADWDGKEDLHDNGQEYALGLDWTVPTLPLQLSASGQFTITGADQASYQVENPSLNSYVVGLGGRYVVAKKVGISLGWVGNFAIDDKADLAMLDTPTYKPTADEKKRVLVYAVGLDYHVF
jgi:long-chain fatty acid transport protein